MNVAQFFDFYKYLLKNKKNPVVNVDASHGEVFVPRDLIDEDGTISLGIGPKSVRNLKVLNDTVYCRATFNKNVFCISFPLNNVIEMSFLTNDE